MEESNLLEKIVALCKRRGFIYRGSEIYGGLAGTWDYGPVGSLFKKNIKDIWWRDCVQLRDDVVGVDAAIIMNPKVWEASGHVEAFTDPLVECKICHERFRADKKEEISEHEKTKHNGKGDWTEPRKFHGLVKAYLGVVEGQEQLVYLRPEITQGVQVNFKNVIDSTRVRIPFGIAQIGKAFRNEITPGNFTFRSREFEQMEVQYFVRPVVETSMEQFKYWKNNRMDWYIGLGIKKENLKFKDHEPDERAHYARAATDILYQFPWGWDELMGIHHRGDWDLKKHQEFSQGGKGDDGGLEYRDPETGENYIPWDIETSAGVDRAMLAFLIDAYTETEKGVILKLHPLLAPYKVAVFPLLGNKPELIDKAKKIHLDLKKDFMVGWDERGNIGKRYASQDEVGTPYCITVDFQTLEDDTVTVRDRDTAVQERVKTTKLKEFIYNKIYGQGESEKY